MILDLVDRYWNGTKSLHKNYKFLGAANQLLNQHLESSSNSVDETHLKTLQMHIKNLQDENRSLQQTLMEKLSHYHNSNNVGKLSNEPQHDTKSMLAEMDSLKKKLIVIQEENKRLKSEATARASSSNNGAHQMEGQNDLMKRDIEIMRIKLKQYEQLQQLTAMLQGRFY